MNIKLTEAINDPSIGLLGIARACGVTYQAVRKWEKNGMPRSEWTGETNYSATIASLSGGKYAKEDFLVRAVA